MAGRRGRFCGLGARGKYIRQCACPRSRELVAGLAPEVLVVIGDVTRAWNRVGPIVAEVVQRGSPMHARTRILAADSDAQPRLRGTIALVLQKDFGAPFIA